MHISIWSKGYMKYNFSDVGHTFGLSSDILFCRALLADSLPAAKRQLQIAIPQTDAVTT